MSNILYIHGMGGGGDSRIPSILSEELRVFGLNVIVRTYDFDPEVAAVQIAGWVSETEPCMVIGESLGALQALRIKGLPHLFVSPALNTSFYFEVLAWLTFIPGVTRLFDRIYKPRVGDRQKLHFKFPVLRKYLPHRKQALSNTPLSGSKDLFYAFFGVNDHYRKRGIVSIRTWKKYFGNEYFLYDGTHFMEEEFVRTILVQKILTVLNINI